MKRFAMDKWGECFAHLAQIAQIASTSPGNQEIPPTIKLRTSTLLITIAQLSELSQMEESRDMAARLINSLNRELPTTCSELQWKLDGLMEQIQNESKKRLFLSVDQADAAFFECDRLFGEAVYANFPSARDDIKEAGNCLVSGRATACVFHLMRVAEIGLRVLAWDREIKFVKQPDSPIELRDWEEILSGIEKAEADIHNYKRTLARDAQLAFYHGAMVELRAFKNLYRHRTAHAREIYDIYQARSAMTHVSGFMRLLASKISETKRTPKEWGEEQL